MSESLAQARERLRPYVEKAKGFSGWMPDVRQTRLGPPPPWDYMDRARQLMKAADAVLDLGTGGGERFGELCASHEGRAVATESWGVNARVASERFGRPGVGVIRCSSLVLPIGDEAFDLVLNRHEEMEPAEISRVLRPGGRVLTQQVWSPRNELVEFIPRRTDWGDHFHGYQAGLMQTGMHIVDAREHETRVAYETLGEYVYLLCIASWEVPDFDPLGAELNELLRMERSLTDDAGLVVHEGHYIIEAVKPASARSPGRSRPGRP